jgi:hypothetical protein
MADVAPPSTKHLLQDTQQAALIQELMNKKKLSKVGHVPLDVRND